MAKIKKFILENPYPFILSVLPLIVFWRNLLPIPGQVFFGNDSILSFYTLSSMVHQLRESSIPLWDPHTFFGVPLLTRPDSLVFYFPLGLMVVISTLLRLSDTHIYLLMELVTIFHFSFAGIGSYLFLKRLRFGDFASFIGGLIYMFNGGMVAFTNTTGLLISISYFPWVLLAFDRLVSSPNLKRALIFSLVFAQPVLTFAWTSAIVYHSIFLFFYFWYLYVSKEVKNLGLTLKFIFLGFVLSALLAAVVVLPALEVPLLSDRANITFSQSAYGGNLRPRQLFDFLIPYLTAQNYGEREVLRLYHETLTFTYVGLATFLLIIPAFFKKHPRRGFFFVAFIISLLFTLGGATPVFGLFYVVFYPIMKPFSEARLAVYIPQFFLAILAGLGVENLTTSTSDLMSKIKSYRGILLSFFKLSLLVAFIIFFRLDEILWRFAPSENITIPFFSFQNAFMVFLVLLGLSVACFYLLKVRKLLSFKIALAMVLFTDLFLYAEKYPINTIGLDPARLLARNAVVQFITKENSSGFYRSDIREIPYNYAPALADINHIDGYLVYLPKVTYQFYSLISRNPRNLLADRIAGIRYFVTESVLDDKNYNLVFQETINSQNQKDFFHLGGGPPTGWVPVPVGTPLRVYENKKYNLYPRLIAEAKRVSDVQAAKLITDQAFNPEAVALVVDSSIGSSLPELTADKSLSGNEELTILPGQNYESNFRATVTTNQLLVTNLPFNQDWQVRVDGQTGEVLRINLSFMGVSLTPGEHEVRFFYMPRVFYAGLLVSLVSLFLVLLALALVRERVVA